VKHKKEAYKERRRKEKDMKRQRMKIVKDKRKRE
jgi:hypothetical protein